MSEYRCRWCTVPAIRWRNGWKHASGGGSPKRACRRRLTDADVELRQVAEAREQAEADLIVRMVRERR